MSRELHEEAATPNLPVHASEANRLPMSYKNAKAALAKCTTVDECRNWQDKAAAIASYALMAKDNELLTSARRVQLLAARRCGLLLKQFDARPQNASKRNNAKGTLLSQAEAAQRAGLSKRRKDTYLRIANVPDKEFESLAEGNRPPTITTVANLGIQRRTSSDGGHHENKLREPSYDAADARAVVRRAIESLRTNAQVTSEGSDQQLAQYMAPTTKTRKALVRVMESYPLADLWWAKALLSGMDTNDGITGDR
jgi:hypothetical protein